MPTSQYPTVVPAIVALLQQNTTVPVFDGPVIADDSLTEAITVGHDGDDESSDVGSFTQDFRTTGGAGAARDEEITIPCAIIVDSGDVAVSPIRARAFAIFAQVENVLRGSVQVGQGPAVCYVNIEGGSCQLVQDEHGAQFRILFTLNVTAVI